jgi:hypothetical protein
VGLWGRWPSAPAQQRAARCCTSKEVLHRSSRLLAFQLAGARAATAARQRGGLAGGVAVQAGEARVEGLRLPAGGHERERKASEA